MEENVFNIDDNLLLKELFSKHKHSRQVINTVKFDKNDVINNKLQIEGFKDKNLIKERNYFQIEEFDKENINDNPGGQFEETKKDKYFNKIIKETLENESLYCSFLDYFDKMSIKNKFSKNINSNKLTLSCSQCFETISNEPLLIKGFSNIFICNKKNEHCYVDFLQKYNKEEVIQLMSSHIKNSFSKEQLSALGLDINEECSESQQFVPVKCSSCHNTIGIMGREQTEYIIFNSI
jgi:hypothetical protein